MSVQIDRMVAQVVWQRQGDGSYVKTYAIQASCSDPAATNPTAKQGGNVNGIVVPAYDGTETVDSFGATCIRAADTAAGAP